MLTNQSQKDELIQIIWDGAVDDRTKSGMNMKNVPVVRPKVEALADAVLAAGYRRPRTVTTVEELDALPTGTVVLADNHRHYLQEWRLSFQKWDDGDWHRGARSGSTHPDNFLPATVLHEPEATK